MRLLLIKFDIIKLIEFIADSLCALLFQWSFVWQVDAVEFFRETTLQHKRILMFIKTLHISIQMFSKAIIFLTFIIIGMNAFLGFFIPFCTVIFANVDHAQYLDLIHTAHNNKRDKSTIKK